MPKSSNAREVEPLWAPAAILPAQFLDRRGLHSREVLLMSAVLEDAFLCIARNVGARDRRRQRELREASDWFFSQRWDWPFAFLPVCDTLGLDGSAVRERVAALVAEHGAAEGAPEPSGVSPVVQRMERASRSKRCAVISYSANRSSSLCDSLGTPGKPESAVGNS